LQYTLKKSLGQHFLHDQQICNMVVDALPEGILQLLEIGPGGGALTGILIEKKWPAYRCIEIDKEKVDYLTLTYPVLRDHIIHDDFLVAEKPFDGHFSVIGNFPYNISTQIVFKILEWRDDVDVVVGMFQKEVAQRIASAHGSKQYGILSVLTQCYYELEYLFDVPASSFTPPPNVVSGVIRMVKRKNPYPILDYKKFKQFVKAAFNQRRKTLRNGLKSILPPEKLTDAIFDKRAEQLSVLEFVQLFNVLYPNAKGDEPG
jgi:16S rRNA (adenine1518-N6/adenine1519-N6)-dimethyltransferase